MSNIIMTPTQARQNFFKLIDLVRKGQKVSFSPKGTNEVFVIVREFSDATSRKNLDKIKAEMKKYPYTGSFDPKEIKALISNLHDPKI